MRLTYGLRPIPLTPESNHRLQNRILHFLSTDPSGSWVAEDAGVVIGLSQSFVRDEYWVLSLIATLPTYQGQGLGRQLLQRALSTTDPSSPGTIQSSTDPAAMALYVSAGFSLHPGVIASGKVRKGRVTFDSRVRHSDQSGIDLVNAVDYAVRGSCRPADIRAMLNEPGCQLLVIDDLGYAVTKVDRIITLAARNEEVATALLESALAEMKPDGAVEVNWLTGNQQWAIRTLVAAGVELHPYGPMMVRGMLRPPSPYIPSGGYG
jgi:GNAT superfamily N-acetyltransferase